MQRPFKLDRDSVVLPKGTRVVLRVEVRGDDDFLHRKGSLATVAEVCQHTYTLQTPGGRTLTVQRDQITPQREDLLAGLGQRQWDYRRLREEVIFGAVVGSQAWGLADEQSDRDVRGCFVAPFESVSGLWAAPSEIADPGGDEAYWEIEKLMHQGLRGDANTLEALWSPLHVEVAPLGEELLRRRRMFVSVNVLGSFGRYAQGQFRKIERSLRRNGAVTELLEAIAHGEVATRNDARGWLIARSLARAGTEADAEIRSVVRSLHDRGVLDSASFDALLRAVGEGRAPELQPPPFRPKNAYNLLRLLHSCSSWLRTGEPLIEVTGALRDQLLRIKRQEVPIESTLASARQISREIEEAAPSTRLPLQPDFEAADELLRRCRREAARRRIGGTALSATATAEARRAPSTAPPDDGYLPDVLADPLPPDVAPAALRRFLGRYLEDTGTVPGRVLWVALTGAHAFGFPSPDSDLDLKGVYTAPAARFLGLEKLPAPVDFLDDWEGREYDLTLNELGQVARLVLGGNGNLIERFLGPFSLVETPAGRRMRELVRDSLSRRAIAHYRGFFRGMQREHEVERRAGAPSAKTLLYAYRVALTGTHLLRTGEVVTDVTPLAAAHGFAKHVRRLIERKRTAEYAHLEDDECEDFRADWPRLEEGLTAAFETSTLPDEPPNADDLEAFLIEQRRCVERCRPREAATSPP